MVKRTESRKRNIKKKQRKNYTKHKRTKHKPHKNKRPKTIKKKKYKGGGSFKGVWGDLFEEYNKKNEKCVEFCGETDEMKAVYALYKTLQETRDKLNRLVGDSQPLHPAIYVGYGLNEKMVGGASYAIDAVNAPYLPIFSTKQLNDVLGIIISPLLNKNKDDSTLSGITIEKRDVGTLMEIAKARGASKDFKTKQALGATVVSAASVAAGLGIASGVGAAATGAVAATAAGAAGAAKLAGIGIRKMVGPPNPNKCWSFKGEHAPDRIVKLLTNDDNPIFDWANKDDRAYVVVNKNCKNVWLTPTNFEEGEILKFAGYVSPDNKKGSDFYVVNKNGFLTCLGNNDMRQIVFQDIRKPCFIVHGSFMRKLMEGLGNKYVFDPNKEFETTNDNDGNPKFDPQNMDCIKVIYGVGGSLSSIEYYNSDTWNIGESDDGKYPAKNGMRWIPHAPIVDSSVPYKDSKGLFDKCLEWFRQDDSRMKVEGIFRVAGTKTVIDKVKKVEDFDKELDDGNLDEHVVASIFKKVVEELDLLPSPEIVDGLKDITDDFQQLEQNLQDTGKLDDFKTLIKFLQEVKEVEENRMNAKNIGIVFGPRLLNSKRTDIAAAATKVLEDSNFVERLINDYDTGISGGAGDDEPPSPGPDIPIQKSITKSVIFIRHCPACHNKPGQAKWEKKGLSGYVSNCMPFTLDHLIHGEGDLVNPNKDSGRASVALQNLHDNVFEGKPDEYDFICSASFRTALTGTLVSHALNFVHNGGHPLPDEQNCDKSNCMRCNHKILKGLLVDYKKDIKNVRSNDG